jgi:DNA-directed RNA polymerase subunit H
MASSNSSLISQIFQSRKILLELMDNIGYDITGYSNFSIAEINAMKMNNQLDMLLEKKDEGSNLETKDEGSNLETKEDKGKKLYIRYFLGKVLRPNNLQEMIDDLFIITETLNKNDTLYIVIKDDVNETLLTELKHIWEKDSIFIVIENIKRLQFNILKHILVPEHKIMNDDDIKKMTIKYNITNLNQLPEISRFDPVARAICLKPGDICHIIRPSKTAIKTDYYRLCV